MSVTLETGRLPNESTEAVPPFQVKQWTLAEFQQLIDLGVFDDQRVELLEGWIVEKMVRNPPHDVTLSITAELVRSLIPEQACLRNQCAITIPEAESAIEPDLSIVAGKLTDYARRHPCGSDILLVIEIADSTLKKDRRKARSYSAGNVPIYWIVDINSRCIEVYEQPEPSVRRYKVKHVFELGASVPFRFDEKCGEIPLREFFPVSFEDEEEA